MTTWGPGRLDVFYLDSAGICRTTFYNGSWHTVTNLGGTWAGSPAAVAWAPGPHRRVRARNRRHVATPLVPGRLGRPGNPATRRHPDRRADGSQLGAGRLDVFWTATRQLQHLWYAGGWAGPESLGGSLTGAPAAVSWSADRIDVFAEGTDQTLQHIFYN